MQTEDLELETEAAVIEAPEPPSARDDVNNDVRAAMESLKAPDEPVEQSADERPRAPDGKFIPKDKAAAPAEAAAPTNLPPVDDTAKASVQQPSTAANAPPVSWAAEAKQEWAKLPPAIHAAVAKREAEVSSGFKQKSEEVRRYEQAIAPIAQLTQSRGIPVEQGIRALAEAQARLDQDPRAGIAWLAQNYGVDLADIAQNPPAPQQPARVDPIYSQIDSRISAVEQHFQNVMRQQNMGVVESFASQPEHKYYAEVEDKLPAIMAEMQNANPGLLGQPLLEAAYERAVWLDPTIRSKVIADQHAETMRAQAAPVQQKFAQANRAAISVKGSGTASAPPPSKMNGNGTAYDDVRAAIHQLRNG